MLGKDRASHGVHVLSHGLSHILCCCVCFRGRLLVGTFVALFFNLLTLLSVKNKPFVFVSQGKILDLHKSHS